MEGRAGQGERGSEFGDGEGLEKMANLDIPKDLSSVEANKYLADACLRFDVKCPPPQTTARLLDKVNN